MSKNEEKQTLWRFCFLIAIGFICIFMTEINQQYIVGYVWKGVRDGWRIGLTFLGLYSFYLALLELSPKSQHVVFTNGWKVIAVALIGFTSIFAIWIIMFYSNIPDILTLIRYILDFLSSIWGPPGGVS